MISINLRTALEKLILTLTLIAIFTALIPINTNHAETTITKPSWAKPGTTLVYAWEDFEDIPLTELDSFVKKYENSSYRWPSHVAFIFTLFSVNETHGVFQATSPGVNQIGELICKWDGSPCLIGPIGNASTPFIAFYKPPQTLKDYPLVVVGNLKAFRIEENITKPGDYPRRFISYYHKDTGILVLNIVVSYYSESKADVAALKLLSTNAISAKPYWASPGVKLAYSVYEMNVSPTNISEVLAEIEKNFTYYASLEPNFFVEILDTNESIATIHTYHLDINQSWVFNYSWATGVALLSSSGSPRSQEFYWDMYIPPDILSLSDYPLVTLGNYQVRMVGCAWDRNYYHKDSGVMIFSVSTWLLENKTYHIYITALVSANIAFPRVYTGEVVVEGNRFIVEAVSNSTISELSYNVNEISFNVSGDPGSLGFCNVSIPKYLVKPGYTIKVYFDGNPINYKLSENSTNYFIYFTYKHSTHRVNIKFEAPEITITTPKPTPTTTLTPTVPSIGTVTTTVVATQTIERTVLSTVVQSSTLLTSITTTTTIRQTDWTLTIVLAIVLFIVGLVAGWVVKRK